ncbi:hypothetical protein [Clostridium coskatii]|uniref:Uncharacterized protein n=1 Tax=Clostridium coskatii TaxID=1705578 RepID=A0A166SZY3_9CLOT|nr:hypothetical protein [Clostridium coskatii]OAA93023.1 hypothetical protein WX73_00341 [Clostridium coskatii]OBR90435.1 hypothetical protein CLCOS_39930 [Clostridium coskatii]
MNRIYKKNEYIIIPVYSEYLIINTNKVFKEGCIHVKNMGIARMLIDLCLEKKLPKNPHFAENLIRISIDKEYIKKLQDFKIKECINYKELMDAHSYKRHKSALRQVR